MGAVFPTARPTSPPPVADAIPPALRRRGGTTGQVFAAGLVAAAVLALFSSRDLPGWTERLGDAPLAHELRTVAGIWDRAMAALGLVRPHETLRFEVRRALDWQWNGDSR